MSLRTVFESQPDRRYIMFGGKGGLGKTTLSATCAFWLASQGKRVLLFSVDPQASLSDIFQKDIFGKGPVPIIQNLWAQEVDADRRIKEYHEWINKITKLREEMRQYDRVAATMRREETMEEDKILGELTYIKERINASSRILTDKRQTAFFFVLVPEEMIILDTKKAAELFAKFDVPLSGYVVNRVLPPDLGAAHIPEYLRNRITMQQRYMKEIQSVFGAQILAYVPEMERDITGLPMIERLAKRLFEEGSKA